MTSIIAQQGISKSTGEGPSTSNEASGTVPAFDVQTERAITMGLAPVSTDQSVTPIVITLISRGSLSPGQMLLRSSDIFSTDTRTVADIMQRIGTASEFRAGRQDQNLYAQQTFRTPSPQNIDQPQPRLSLSERLLATTVVGEAKTVERFERTVNPWEAREWGLFRLFQGRTNEQSAEAAKVLTPPELTKSEHAKPEMRTIEAPRTELLPGKDPSGILTPGVQAILNDPRNEAARIVQQLLNPELSVGNQTPPPSRWRPEDGLGVNTTVTELRASINERLSQLREGLSGVIEQTAPHAQPLRGIDPERTSAAAIAPGSFAHSEPVSYHAHHPTTTERAERGSDTSGWLRRSGEATSLSPTPLARSEVATGAAMQTPRGADHSSTSLERKVESGTNLLDALSRAVSQIANLNTLKKIDSALETSVISAAAALALGVMGADVALKSVAALGREALRRLRDDQALSKRHEGETKTIEEMCEQLEELYQDRGIEKIEKPTDMVADITGIVVTKDNLPVEGVLVDGGSLGTTTTNPYGHFTFQNIPLNSAYALAFRERRYTFFPGQVVGTVSTTNYIKIVATKIER